MSQKFSIVVEVVDGKPVATAYFKQDANEARLHFNRIRDEQKEGYFFQHPIENNRCKSKAQQEASVPTAPSDLAALERQKQALTPVQPAKAAQTAPEPVVTTHGTPKNAKSSKPVKNSVSGVSDTSPNEGEAIDMP